MREAGETLLFITVVLAVFFWGAWIGWGNMSCDCPDCEKARVEGYSDPAKVVPVPGYAVQCSDGRWVDPYDMSVSVVFTGNTTEGFVFNLHTCQWECGQ